MLKDEFCQSECFVAECGFDGEDCKSCAPYCFAEESYVAQGSFEGLGTSIQPYTTLQDALFSASKPYSIVYLLGSRVSLSSTTLPPGGFNLVSFSHLLVQSLLCEERRTEQCSSHYTEIDVTQVLSLVVSSVVTFEKVVFTNYHLFVESPLKYCPYLEFEDGVWVDVRGTPASEDYVATAGICSLFKDFSLFQVETEGFLTLREVNVTHFTMQPLSFVNIQNGSVLLEDVHFFGFHTLRSVTPAGVVIQTSTCDKQVCGDFTYNGGSVNNMNSELEYAENLKLSPFLYAKSLKLIEIASVTFTRNFIAEAYSNPLVLSDRTLLYFENFYELRILESDFLHNFVGGGVVVVNSNVILPKDSQEGQAYLYAQTHILIFNTTFDSNLGEHSLIVVHFAGDVLNVNFSNAVCSNNAIEGNSLIRIESESEASQALADGALEQAVNSVSGQKEEVWVAARFLVISEVDICQSLAFSLLLHIRNLANVRISGLRMCESGDFDSEVLTRVHAEVQDFPPPQFPPVPICSSFVWTDGCVYLSFVHIAFEDNQCLGGTTSLIVTNSPSLVTISHFLCLRNTGFSANGLMLDIAPNTELEMDNLVFVSNSNIGGPLSYYRAFSSLRIRDSHFESNSGVYGACLYLYLTQSVAIANSTFLNNTSVDSMGGVFVWWVGNLNPLTLAIQDCVFEQNSATRGGALAFDVLNTTDVQMQISNCRFVANHAVMFGAALYVGMPVSFTGGSLITDCIFEDNISAYGAIALMHLTGVLSIANSLFRSNCGSGAAAVSIESFPEAVTLMANLTFTANACGPVILKPNSRTNSTFKTTNCAFSRNQKGSVSMEGGYWQDDSSLFESSTVSAIQLAFGGVAHIVAGRVLSNRDRMRGGGIHIMSGSFLECVGCTFYNNSAGNSGGALFSEQHSWLFLKDCNFRNNSAVTGGGVLFLTSSQSEVSVVDSCLIEDNSGGSFGVMFAQTSNLEVRNSTLRNNSGQEYPGITLLMAHATISECVFQAMSGDTAAFLALFTSSSANISLTKFEDAHAHDGGIMYLSSISNLTVSRSSFSHLTTDKGGVIAAFSSSRVVLSEVTIDTVQSLTSGSLLYLSDSSISISKSDFSNYNLGGIFGYKLEELDIAESRFIDGEAQMGAAAYCYQCYGIHISYSTFSHLSASQGGVFYFEALENNPLGAVTIANSQFLENNAETGGVIYSLNHHISVLQSLLSLNRAYEGGALYLDCTIAEMCSASVTETDFIENTAGLRGGGVSWLFTKPVLTNVTFVNNSAEYGADIASSPIALIIDTGRPTQLTPGQLTDSTLIVSLRDHYGQTITMDDSSAGIIESANCTVSGETRVTASRGVFKFGKFLVYARPNSSVQLTVSSKAISASQKGDPDPHFPALSFEVRMRDCLPGEHRTSDSCVKCSSGTFSFHPEDPCQTCLSNALCLGNFSVIPNAGFWRSDMFSPQIWECPNPESCLGGLIAQQPLNFLGECALGYTGNLCQSCLDGYSRTGKNKCAKCPSKAMNVARLAGLGCVMLFCVCLMVWSTLRSAVRPAATHAILIRIFINYLQLVLLVSEFKLNWPEPVIKLFESQESVGQVTEQIYSVDCFLYDEKMDAATYYRKMLLITVMPGGLIAVAVLFWLMVAAQKRSLKVLKRQCPATVVILLFLVLPVLVQALFSMFSCVEIESGQYWLAVDMDIPCWNSVHTSSLLKVALPGLLVWVTGMPLLCLLLLVKYRRRHDEVWLRIQFGFLINGYRRRCYYWEFVILYRKILVICVSVFLNTSIPVQALTVQILLLLAFIAQYSIRPYSLSLLNSVEMWSIIVADVTIFCGLYFLTNEISVLSSWFFFLLIVAINVLFAMYWLAGILNHLLLRLSRRFRILRRLMQPGNTVDEELELLLTLMKAPSAKALNIANQSLESCYREILGSGITIHRFKSRKYRFYSHACVSLLDITTK